MDKQTQDLLDDAASRLMAVALADPAVVPPAMRLSCLWVTDLLQASGARTAERSREIVHNPADSIRAALAVLATLPTEVFAQRNIVEAAAVARAALAAAG